MVERLAGAFEQQRLLLADTPTSFRNPLTAIREPGDHRHSDGPDDSAMPRLRPRSRCFG